jgi:hypothetical protein
MIADVLLPQVKQSICIMDRFRKFTLLWASNDHSWHTDTKGVIGRKTDNDQWTKRQTMINKILQRKLIIEQHEPH